MRWAQFQAQAAVLQRRAPDRPGEVIIKRLVALEGDWLYVPGRVDVEKIPKVRMVLRVLVLDQHACMCTAAKICIIPRFFTLQGLSRLILCLVGLLREQLISLKIDWNLLGMPGTDCRLLYG